MKQPSRSFRGQFCVLLGVLTALPLLAIPEVYIGPAGQFELAHRKFVLMQALWLTIPLSLGLAGAYLILTQKRESRPCNPANAPD